MIFLATGKKRDVKEKSLLLVCLLFFVGKMRGLVLVVLLNVVICLLVTVERSETR